MLAVSLAVLALSHRQQLPDPAEALPVGVLDAEPLDLDNSLELYDYRHYHSRDKSLDNDDNETMKTVVPATVLVAHPGLLDLVSNSREKRNVEKAIKHPLIIGYSPRAASTLAFEVFAHQIGMLSKAMLPSESSSTGWIHLWHGAAREEIEHHFVKPLHDAGKIKDVPSVKITMNPYRRAVASYWHQIYYDFGNVGGATSAELAAKRTEKENRKRTERISGMHEELGITDPHTQRYRVSFLAWLMAVRNVGWDVLDTHSQPQYTTQERDGHFKFKYVCHMEQDLAECLQHAAKQAKAPMHDLPRGLCDMEPFKTQSATCEHEITKRHNPRRDVARLAFDQISNATVGVEGLLYFPHPSDFYHGEAGRRARDLVEQLYVEDFHHYHYATGDVRPEAIDG